MVDYTRILSLGKKMLIYNFHLVNPVISEFKSKIFNVLYNWERRQNKTEKMKFKFASICLVCVSVLCGCEEHSHHHPAEHHHLDHDDHHLDHCGHNHSHPAHEDHQLVHDDHEHPHHRVPIPDTDLPLAARDYRVWLAATGLFSSKSEFKPLS